MPSPAAWPLTSADGECTRKYSAESRPVRPSSKRTSRSRERLWYLISVGGGIESPAIFALENVAAQVFVLHERAQVRVHVRCIDDDVLAAAIRGLERH